MNTSNGDVRNRDVYGRLLEHKIAVVYGASGGIGSSVARAFARDGAKVHLVGRHEVPLEAVSEAIRSEQGAAQSALVDASDEAAVADHVQHVLAQDGRIDILFNAIGMADVQGTPLLDMPLNSVLQPVSTAVATQFNTARAVARAMVKQRSGVILTVTAEPTPGPNIGGFGAACAAIEGLWRSLAAELGPSGIRLIVIRSVGSADTPAVGGLFAALAHSSGSSVEEVIAAAGSATLLGRLPQVNEIANVATIMASDRASAITAAIVNATCGAWIDQ